jgi:glycosyltransferase involved in cell wall biosynthesis
MIELSVVLISKNQAWNIARLMESVIRELNCVESWEILLVDSASTDNTVELAKRYPASVFRLLPGQKLSPAIGRYVGYQRARGEFVLFLDGDTELIQGWLQHALCVMRDTPDAGAVTGHVINKPTSAAKEPASVQQAQQMDAPKEVLWASYGGGGAALYRRSVLEQVGTFNPNLNADEEPELGCRVRYAGYRILELDHPIVRHFNDVPVALSAALSRRRRNFHLGMGQSIRYHLGTKLLWLYLKGRPWGFAAALLLASGIGACLVSLVTGDSAWFGLWFLGFLFLVTYVAVRKRSLKGALVAAFNWLLLAEGFTKGFLIKPVPLEQFRANVRLIQDLHDSPQRDAGVHPIPAEAFSDRVEPAS